MIVIMMIIMIMIFRQKKARFSMEQKASIFINDGNNGVQTADIEYTKGYCLIISRTVSPILF